MHKYQNIAHLILVGNYSNLFEVGKIVKWAFRNQPATERKEKTEYNFGGICKLFSIWHKASYENCVDYGII